MPPKTKRIFTHLLSPFATRVGYASNWITRDDDSLLNKCDKNFFMLNNLICLDSRLVFPHTIFRLVELISASSRFFWCRFTHFSYPPMSLVSVLWMLWFEIIAGCSCHFTFFCDLRRINFIGFHTGMKQLKIERSTSRICKPRVRSFEITALPLLDRAIKMNKTWWLSIPCHVKSVIKKRNIKKSKIYEQCSPRARWINSEQMTSDGEKFETWRTSSVHLFFFTLLFCSPYKFHVYVVRAASTRDTPFYAISRLLLCLWLWPKSIFFRTK